MSALLLLAGCNEESPGPVTSGAGGAGGADGSSSATGSGPAGSGGGSSSTTGGMGGAAGSGGSSSATGGGAGGASGSGGAGGSGSGSSSVMIINPGFEANPVAAGQYNDTIIPTGWMIYDPNSIIGQNYNSIGVLNPTGTSLYPGGAPEGTNVALIFLWRMQTDGIAAGLTQTLTHTLLPNSKYTLRVKVGNIATMGTPAYDLNGFPGYRVELVAAATVIASDNNTLKPAEGAFLQSVVSFTTGGAHPQLGEKVGIRLLNLNKANSGIEVNYDDIELDVAPNP